MAEPAERSPRPRKALIVLAALFALLIVYASLPPAPPPEWRALNGESPFDVRSFESGWLAQGAHRSAAPAQTHTVKSYYGLHGDYQQNLKRVEEEAVQRVGKPGAGASRLEWMVFGVRPRSFDAIYTGPGWAIFVRKMDQSIEGRPGTAIVTVESTSENIAGVTRRLADDLLP